MPVGKLAAAPVVRSARAQEVYNAQCPACGLEFEQPAAAADEAGLITCPCGASNPVQWRPEK